MNLWHWQTTSRRCRRAKRNDRKLICLCKWRNVNGLSHFYTVCSNPFECAALIHQHKYIIELFKCWMCHIKYLCVCIYIALFIQLTFGGRTASGCRRRERCDWMKRVSVTLATLTSRSVHAAAIRTRYKHKQCELDKQVRWCEFETLRMLYVHGWMYGCAPISNAHMKP